MADITCLDLGDGNCWVLVTVSSVFGAGTWLLTVYRRLLAVGGGLCMAVRPFVVKLFSTGLSRLPLDLSRPPLNPTRLPLIPPRIPWTLAWSLPGSSGPSLPPHQPPRLPRTLSTHPPV